MKNIAPLLLTVSLSLLFAFSFIPVSEKLPVRQDFAPVLLALVFYISVLGPKHSRGKPQLFITDVWLTLPLPLIIAFIFGRAVHAESQNWVWYVFAMPLTEELLFRGWLYAILKRKWNGIVVTFNLPFSIPILMTALGFSLWHLQNYSTLGPTAMAFQLFYTFWVGIWLGWVYEKTQSLYIPILFHEALNGVCYLGW